MSRYYTIILVSHRRQCTSKLTFSEVKQQSLYLCNIGTIKKGEGIKKVQLLAQLNIRAKASSPSILNKAQNMLISSKQESFSSKGSSCKGFSKDLS